MKQIALICMLVVAMIPTTIAKEVASENVLVRSLLAEEPTSGGGGGKLLSACQCSSTECDARDQYGNCICNCPVPQPPPECACPVDDCTAKDQYGNCLEPTCTCPCVCPEPKCTAKDQDGNCIEWEQQACNCPSQSQVDVVFVIDSTGSMADEIRTVKDYIAQMVQFAPKGSPKLRIGVVSYRDYELEEKEYLVRTQDLTADINRALKFIEDIDAAGGGDQPEAVADALFEAIEHDMSWDKNARKAIILIGDAPPHGEGGADRNYRYGSPNGYNYRDEIEVANKKGITIYTMSCSGMDEVGLKIWKEIADKTNGFFTQLSYVRTDVDKYYSQIGLPATYATEAKKSADYDSSTNTILTNNLGAMAKAAVSREASGIQHEPKEEPSHATNPNTSFFSEVWKKLTFWS